jgi:DNA-binding LacI/PurR family transcriptional regulator
MIEQRRLGYRDALTAAAVEIDPALERFEGTWGTQLGPTLVDQLMRLEDPPTAIMCGNDLLALGVLQELRRRKLRVPADVAVTGFNNYDFAEFVDPPLTTVRTPGYEMGRAGALNLIDGLEGIGAVEQRLEFPVELMLRESA